MSSLLPCIQCRRHVRVGDERCPFCGSELTARAVPRWLVTAPKGAKRATLFAIGVSLASACSEGNDVAIYGAPFLGGSGGQSGAGGTDPGGSGGMLNGGSGGDGGGVPSVPVYGAPVPPLPEPDASAAPADAAPADAAPADAGDAQP